MTARRFGEIFSYQLALCILVLSMLAIIEIRHPYFFLQDDNRDMTLPLFVHNFRAISQGELPLFNFHQFLGAPSLSGMQAAALYPFNYIAVFLSKAIFGHHLASMEFVAIFHLLIATLGCFYFLSHFGLKKESCLFGAVAWAFCGVNITCGNSWMFFLEHAAYFPWLLLLSFKQIDNFSVNRFILLAIVKVLMVFIGYPQIFLYCVTFEFAAVILYFVFSYNHRLTRLMIGQPASDNHRAPGNSGFVKYMKYYFLNYLCVLVLVSPLLLPALHQMSLSAERNALISWEEYSFPSYDLPAWINGLTTPLSEKGLDKTFVPLHSISHIGYLSLLFLGVALFKSRNDHRSRHIVLFLVLAVLAVIWAADILVTKFFYLLPIYNRMRWPFKLIFFSSFFMVAAASFGFDAFISRINSTNRSGNLFPRAVFALLIGIHASNFTILYAASPQESLGLHLDKVPFDEPFRKELSDGRFVSVGFDFNANAKGKLYGYTAPSLGFNYATLWGLYSIAGHDVFIPEKNSKAGLGLNYDSILFVEPGYSLDLPAYLPLGYLREWSVKHYIVNKNIQLRNIGDLVLAYSDPARNIFYDPRAKPFVSWADRTHDEGIAYAFRTNSIEIESDRTTDGVLQIAVLYNPFFKATLDGKKTGITETSDWKMSVFVPKGAHSIKIEYADPYFTYGLIFVGIFCVVGGAALLMSKQRSGETKVSCDRA